MRKAKIGVLLLVAGLVLVVSGTVWAILPMADVTYYVAGYNVTVTPSEATVDVGQKIRVTVTSNTTLTKPPDGMKDEWEVGINEMTSSIATSVYYRWELVGGKGWTAPPSVVVWDIWAKSNAAGKTIDVWFPVCADWHDWISYPYDVAHARLVLHVNPLPPLPQYSLTTQVLPPGWGSVTPSSGHYSSGTVVSVTAKPSSEDYVFDCWSGDAWSIHPTIDVVMNKDKHLKANFKEASWVCRFLFLEVKPEDSGNITVSPQGQVFEDICHGYTDGQVVTLTANPAESYKFSHWSGDLGGDDRITTVVMNIDKHVTANFTYVPNDQENGVPPPDDPPEIPEPNWYLITSGTLLSAVGAVMIVKYKGES